MANPRAEAEDVLGGDYEARVLEPSPPAVTEPPFADDPVAPGEVPEGRKLVSPVHNRGDLTWDEIAREEPELAPWCAERWLGAGTRLEPLPGAQPALRAPGGNLRILTGDLVPGQIAAVVHRRDELSPLRHLARVHRIVGIGRLGDRRRGGLQDASFVVAAQHVLGLRPRIRHRRHLSSPVVRSA